MRLFAVADVSGPRSFHIGDEAMLEANLTKLRQLAPEVGFTVLSGDPEWTSRYYAVQSVRTPSIPEGHTGASWTRRMVEINDISGWSGWLGDEICAALRDCSGLVVSGGGNISATWPIRLLERVALIELSHQYGLPAVITGQTLGPRITPDQRELLARSLPKAKWLGVRDQSSSALARSLGVPSEAIHHQIDDAFFLEPLVPHSESAHHLTREHQRWIAVTLDASFAAPARAHQLEVLGRQLDSLAESLGAAIVFVPHVTGDTTSDAPAGESLAAYMRSELLQLDVMQPREVRWLMEQAAMVVSTRYHPLVFATAAGTPALGIWTDDYTRIKLRGAMAHAGLEGYCIPIEEVEKGFFFPLALELWYRRDALRTQLGNLQDKARAWEAERWTRIGGALNLRPNTESPAPARPISALQFGPFVSSTPGLLTDEQWGQYDRDGYLRLGKILDDKELTRLRERIDAITLGRIRYPTLQIQLGYVEIQGLEVDPLVLEIIRRDLFREICARHYGAHASVSVFRTMAMNKPADQGNCTPWHQDAGDVWKLDRDPLVTLWVALESWTRASGCFKAIPGSHRLGLLSGNGSFVNASDAERHCPENDVEYLELKPGEALLLHNWVLRGSDGNGTATLTRALTACYMDGRTIDTLSGKRYPIVFGDYPDLESTMPFVGVLQEENRHLRQAAGEAERFAKSLLEDNRRREEMRREAEKYAKSLEAELSRLRKSRTPARAS